MLINTYFTLRSLLTNMLYIINKLSIPMKIYFQTSLKYCFYFSVGKGMMIDVK
jgi:hypothetical protein